VAAALATTLLSLQTQGVGNLLVGWILPFALAYLGAWLGEKLQGTR
jgi:hypothetical protein